MGPSWACFAMSMGALLLSSCFGGLGRIGCEEHSKLVFQSFSAMWLLKISFLGAYRCVDWCNVCAMQGLSTLELQFKYVYTVYAYTYVCMYTATGMYIPCDVCKMLEYLWVIAALSVAKVGETKNAPISC